MKRLLLFFVLAASLMSFTAISSSFGKKSPKTATAPAKVKHIDITVPTTNGCSVRIVGDLSYSFLPPHINGFQGNLIISGGGNCPNVTLAINYAAKSVSETSTGMEFDSQEICKIKKVNWFPGDMQYAEVLNDTKLNEALVKEVKSGECGFGK